MKASSGCDSTRPGMFLHCLSSPGSLGPINTAFVDRLNFQHAQANWSWSLSNDRQGWKSAFQKSIPASPPSRNYWHLSLWMQYHINIFRFLSLVSIAGRNPVNFWHGHLPNTCIGLSVLIAKALINCVRGKGYVFKNRGNEKGLEINKWSHFILSGHMRSSI